MATKINQKEYLKKYLSNDVTTTDKKKKKKKSSKSSHTEKTVAVSASNKTNVRIIDDDIDISRLRPIDDHDLDQYAIGEEAPQIVGVVDDRPAELIASEDYKQSEKWKVLRNVDGALTVNQLDSDGRVRRSGAVATIDDDREQMARRRFTRYDSEDEAAGDFSPVRRSSTKAVTDRRAKEVKRSDRRSWTPASPASDQSPVRRRNRSPGSPKREGDLSPVRRSSTKDATDRRVKEAKRSDRRSRTPASPASDQSPVRRRNRSSGSPKPGRSDRQEKDVKRNDRRSRTPASPARDQSPVRRRNKSPSSPTPKHSDRRQKRRSHTPDRVPIKSTTTASPDQSPVRRRHRSRSRSATPPIRQTRRSSADKPAAGSSRRRPRSRDSHARSPAATRRSPSPSAQRSRRRSVTPDASPPRRQQRHDIKRERPPIVKQEPRASDSDQSPVRRHHNADSDASPPRRRRRQRSDLSADASPPRRGQRKSPSPAPRQRRRSRNGSPAAVKSETTGRKPKLSRWSRDRSTEPPAPANAKMMRTLDGKAAGLQNAQALRKESDGFRSREAALFEAMAGSSSGRDAEAVVRDRRTGRVRDVEAEMEVEHEKIRKELERKAVYDRWGKGVKQLEAHQTLRADEQHEASKPLARYADDADRDALLRERTRADDPMLEYVLGKQSELEAGKPARPVYRGAYPDNRFGLRPGYRWDGVDRSNGFEKRWFEVQSRSKAAEEETYKYMTEDM